MRTQKRTKLVHEGRYLAEVDIELLISADQWSPYLSVVDVYKLDDVWAALNAGDTATAARYGRIVALTPLAVEQALYLPIEEPVLLTGRRKSPGTFQDRKAVAPYCSPGKVRPLLTLAPQLLTISLAGSGQDLIGFLRRCERGCERNSHSSLLLMMLRRPFTLSRSTTRPVHSTSG